MKLCPKTKLRYEFLNKMLLFYTILKKTPYSQEEIVSLKDFCTRNLFDLVHYPGITAGEANQYNRFKEPIYYDLVGRILERPLRFELYRNYLFQLRPATDNRPFFNNTFKLERLKETYESLGQKWLPFLQGEFLILLLVLQSFLISLVLILFPVLRRRAQKRMIKGNRHRVFFYFFFLGAGFMCVEITLIQRYILYIGHPLFSTAFILCGLLLASGTGSLASHRITGNSPGHRVRLLLFLCAGLVILFSLLSPLILQMTMAWRTGMRLVLSSFMIFPLGFLMGIPFPTGIRILKDREGELIPWAWASNALASVIFSAGALAVAFYGGYSAVFLLGALFYLGALSSLGFAGHGDESNI